MLSKFIQYDGPAARPIEYVDENAKTRETYHPEVNGDGFAIYTGPDGFVAQNISRHPEFYHLYQSAPIRVCFDNHRGGREWKQVLPWGYKDNGAGIEWFEDKELTTIQVPAPAVVLADVPVVQNGGAIQALAEDVEELKACVSKESIKFMRDRLDLIDKRIIILSNANDNYKERIATIEKRLSALEVRNVKLAVAPAKTDKEEKKAR